MRRTWVKCVCAALCVLFLTAGGVGLTLILSEYANGRGGFYESSSCWRVTGSCQSRLCETIDLWQLEEESLSYFQKKQLEENAWFLAAENTNFRYRYMSPDGTVLSTNVPDGHRLEETVYNIYRTDYEVDVYNDYGQRVDTQTYLVEYGVAAPLTAEDEYSAALNRFTALREMLPTYAWGSAACLILGLILLGLLICAAGRRPDREEIVLNVQDRIPFDLYLAAAVFLGGLSIGVGDSMICSYHYYQEVGALIAFGAVALGVTTLFLASLLTTATRIKSCTLFRNTLIWRVCAAVKRAFRALPMVWRAAALFLAYLLGTVVTGATIILIPVFQGLVLVLLCRWVLQWRRIREATGAIVAGQADVAIDNGRFYPDLKEHAGQLNDLGAAIDHAVEERMKSERMKSELITNVSHDLKTPLTSIINYVDLLKKEDIQDPKAREYIEVLDRKSQRLKKLTEDLVEASKASSGTLTVAKEELDLCQLVRQGLGEYEERLEQAGLTLVPTLPEEPLWVRADGRHLWRVMDNLLGNCVKYAMPGTRVYLELHRWDGQAVLSVKNISKQPLNMAPERLMERFVRGDESRTTEGSGLGLSIAQSLTELQGGTFWLNIDGDLFKVTVRLPALSAPGPDGGPASPGQMETEGQPPSA